MTRLPADQCYFHLNASECKSVVCRPPTRLPRGCGEWVAAAAAFIVISA